MFWVLQAPQSQQCRKRRGKNGRRARRMGEGNVAKRLERRICNSEASGSPSSDRWLTVTVARVQILDQACKQPAGLPPASCRILKPVNCLI